MLTADGVLIKNGKILLIKRKNEPWKGMYALPGGFVEYGERVEDTVLREVFEETGLKASIIALVGIYSSPDRDPRGHIITVAYLHRMWRYFRWMHCLRLPQTTRKFWAMR
jgi:8-oxo-dGTP diphosphatase